MREKIAASAEPWSGAWNGLTSSGLSRLGQTPAPLDTLIRGGADQNFGQVIRELKIAYALALRWKVSGDSAYGDLAIAYLNAWSSTLKTVTGNSDRFLAAGLYGYQFANIGEIMKTYSGWAAADRERLVRMMVDIFYPMNHQFLVTHNGSCTSHYWANWDLANIAGMMAVGIFADRRDLYQEALDYLYHGAGNGALDNLLYYMHAGNMGQYQESGRDQGHTTLGVSLFGIIAKMAWNQGDDLFAYNNYELLALSEYVARYNLLDTVPFTPYGPNCASAAAGQAVISDWARGNRRAAWELILNHYQNRLGIAAPWSEKMAAQTRPEYPGNGDEPGWGTLTESRDAPALGGAPRGLTARLNGGAVELSWWGVTGAESYQLKRALSAAGPYGVVANVAAGQLLTYTDVAVTGGQDYFYQVTAISPVGESGPSSSVSVTAGNSLKLHLAFDDTNTPGVVGQARAFNGTDDYVTLDTGVAAELGDFTVAAWIYMDKAKTWARLFDFGRNDHRYMTLVPVDSQGQTCFMITKVSYFAEQKVCGGSVPVGQWTHVAFTLSGGTGILYINGVEIARNAGMTLSPFQLGRTEQNWLGRSQYSADPLLAGKIDDFRLYGGALSATEIGALMALGTL